MNIYCRFSQRFKKNIQEGEKVQFKRYYTCVPKSKSMDHFILK